MNVRIKRIDNLLPLPQYETNGAVAFDFIVRIDTIIPAQGVGRAPANVVIEIPQGYMLWVSDRSSTLKKTGLIKTEGIIDQDFCGDNDEIQLQFYNPTDYPITLNRGDKVSQGIFLPVGIAEWEEVESMGNIDRGGFGSTDEPNPNNLRPIINRKGKLIVIDGIDGTGKATQTNLLLKRLQKDGYDVGAVDFPQYGARSAGMVENYLNGKYGSSEDVSPYIASFFYMADRYDASFSMRSQLNQGKIILSNRYVSASMGHQGSKFDSAEERNRYLQWLDQYEYEVFGIPRPDITIVLHIPAEKAQELIDQKASREYIGGAARDLHENDLNHLKRAEQTYLELCEQFSDFILIECVQSNRLLSIEEVQALVWEKIQTIL
ncbi:hypothetical protein CL632_00410 [bacterium]|jgi:dTMP kinase|nr:hypothetical protein [bacterium]MDP6571804.1 deoxynucleoside kinase [Patescibacteria group bacterium]MDP6756317.1 deoxynucleoside kinase [Patescibacteria group bacterium]|tara:strand:- start:8127 stop:9257 length:1131 start_codon:yes stop_codon:yes gene_type:complete